MTITRETRREIFRSVLRLNGTRNTAVFGVLLGVILGPVALILIALMLGSNLLTAWFACRPFQVGSEWTGEVDHGIWTYRNPTGAFQVPVDALAMIRSEGLLAVVSTPRGKQAYVPLEVLPWASLRPSVPA